MEIPRDKGENQNITLMSQITVPSQQLPPV